MMKVKPMRRTVGITVVAVALGVLAAASAWGQDPPPERIVPTNHAVLTGYGTIQFGTQTQGEHENAFMTKLNPIFLYQFQDRVLFEAELEFELEDGVTKTGLEYGQVDFILNDHVVLSGGKMMLPFGVFGPRLHPSWINRFATIPPIFGHDTTVFGEPIAPILADVGVMARGVMNAGRGNLALSGYVTQGPGEDAMAGHGSGVRFPASSEDNNRNKMTGGRIDVDLPPWAEVNLSGLTAHYDDAGALGFSAFNAAGEVHFRNTELRVEYVDTRQQVREHSGLATMVRRGVYAQAAYRRSAWEPVVRWTQAFDTKQERAVTDTGKTQLGLGLDYWISPSIAVMGGYELNREKEAKVLNDRFVIHFAFGF